MQTSSFVVGDTNFGKVALITGANSGIGRVTAIELALEGYTVFLACRSRARTEPVLAEIARLSNGQAKAHFLLLDLGDLDSVRACAVEFLRYQLPLHVFIGNAGLAGQRGMTASGFELTFGTCHVGHFLLVQLLLECIKAAAPARIVMVSSRAHREVQELDLTTVQQPTSSRGGLREYAVAKLANVLFVQELARRLAGTEVTTYALHPGRVATNVWRALPGPVAWLLKRFMISEEQGAATTLYCVRAKELASHSGRYYADCSEEPASATANDGVLAARLWAHSEQWVARQ